MRENLDNFKVTLSPSSSRLFFSFEPNFTREFWLKWPKSWYNVMEDGDRMSCADIPYQCCKQWVVEG